MAIHWAFIYRDFSLFAFFVSDLWNHRKSNQNPQYDFTLQNFLLASTWETWLRQKWWSLKHWVGGPTSISTVYMTLTPIPQPFLLLGLGLLSCHHTGCLKILLKPLSLASSIPKAWLPAQPPLNFTICTSTIDKFNMFQLPLLITTSVSSLKIFFVPSDPST